MEIRWNDIGLEEWDHLIKAAPKSTLLQSWPYAQAMRITNQMTSRFGRVVEAGKTIAIFQLQEVKLASFYHVIVLDRGPIWLSEKVTNEQWREFASLLDKEFPKKLGRRRRFIPELTIKNAVHDITKSTSFKRKGKGYQSIWVDLSQSEEELRAGLKQKWRNTLNQSFKKDMEIDIGDSAFTFNWLIRRYHEDRKKRSYQGPSVKILQSL